MSDERPKTVWDLCEQVCEAIEARPMNYYQGVWARSVEHVIYNYTSGSTRVPEATTEACGTAFCRAGWMVAIADQMNGPDMVSKDLKSNHSFIMDRATAILKKAGVPISDIRYLFGSEGAGSLSSECKWGSKEYAAQGVKGMRDFMTKYEKQLKETPLD